MSWQQWEAGNAAWEELNVGGIINFKLHIYYYYYLLIISIDTEFLNTSYIYIMLKIMMKK